MPASPEVRAFLERPGMRFAESFLTADPSGKLAFDKIKIDQSFVRSITYDQKSEAIASATVALAHGLGLAVIAEGVEDDDRRG